MIERPARNPSACCAVSQSAQAICEKSAPTSPTATMNATPLTATALFGGSNTIQKHHESCCHNFDGGARLSLRLRREQRSNRRESLRNGSNFSAEYDGHKRNKRFEWHWRPARSDRD